MVDFLEIISRIKYLTGKKRDKELADLFNISPADFLNRKKRGTLLPLIIEWGIHESVNLDWLLTGQGPVCRQTATVNDSALDAAHGIDPKTSEFLRMTHDVLASGTI